MNCKIEYEVKCDDHDMLKKYNYPDWLKVIVDGNHLSLDDYLAQKLMKKVCKQTNFCSQKIGKYLITFKYYDKRHKI